jgi:mono/diheme cytochrome c family protein
LIIDIDEDVDEETGHKFVNVERYENFYDLYETSPNGHDYVTCLETDPEGNFYFLHARQGVMKVAQDGSRVESIATGLRNPNGLSVSPTGEITAAPQEGEWTPASAIFMVRDGDHFGYGGPKITPQRPLGYDPPLCWIPRLVDNSCGGQCWVPSDNWGLPAGSLLHFSFGQCTALLAVRESVDGVWQGGVVPLPWKFQSGVSRGRFSPHDGQLYVSGLKGWVTSAVQDGCLHRVRYVGGAIPWPVKVKSYRNGIAFTFGCELDRASAENPENYRVQACNYRYSQGYGSPDLRPSHPTVEGRDEWDVASATLLDDRRTVFLEIPELAPVMQIVANWAIQSADGIALANSYNGTIHRLPDRSFDVPASSRKARPGRLTQEEERRLVPGLTLMLRQQNQFHALPARLLAAYFPAEPPPHAQLTPGEYEVHAEGYLKSPLSGSYRFRINATVEAYLTINDQRVNDDPEVRLHKGYNKVRFSARSAAEGPTTFRLIWQSDAFAEEPVPATAWFSLPDEPNGIDLAQMRHARELMEQFQCAKCHESNHLPPSFTGEPTAPSLKELSGRMTERWLTAWLLNPRALRHRAEMPALFDPESPQDRQAVADLAAYLLRPSAASVPETELAPDASGEVLYEDLGCIACHRFTRPEEDDAWNRDSLHFTPEKFPGDSLIAYLRQPQRHHRFTRMPDFQLSESEAELLTAFIEQQATGTLKSLPELMQADAGRGRKVFVERRCGQCHGPLDPAAKPSDPVPLTAAPLSLKRGCLAESASGRHQAPRFDFADDDREALRQFLSRQQEPLEPLSAAVRSAALVGRLNCTACHHRDQVVSPRGEIIAEESNRGVPAAALPNLTFVGEKLQVDWMRRLFRGEIAQKTRPWLPARMPAFPAYADELARGLAAEHGFSAEPEASATVAAELVEIGRRLTLKDNGLDCRQCHAVAGQQPTGDDKTKIAPGIDFAETKHRLRADFYRRFVLDPPRFDVTIRMPKLALDGKTTQAVNVFDGDAVRQFDALWAYIQSLPD